MCHPSNGGAGERVRSGYSQVSVLAALDPEKRADLPLWTQVGLSAGFTFVLLAFGGSLAFLGSLLSDVEVGTPAFVVLGFLIVVPFLVAYAYPPSVRRWPYFAAFEACVLGGFTLPIPLVYLPWLIVTRRAWRSA
jgi:hypothetical protein